ILEGGKYGKSLQPLPPEVTRAAWERRRPMNVDEFAAKALRAIARNQAIIVIPARWKLMWWLYRMSPSLALYLGRKALQRWKKTWEKHKPQTEVRNQGSEVGN